MTSSTSGIEVSAELRSAYESARRVGGQTAFIKVQIRNDQLQSTHVEKKGGGGWSRDFDSVARYLDAEEPAFIIFFKNRDDVVLLQYTPEDATVKHKMSYSASKSALNSLLNARQFGAGGASFGSSKAASQYFGTTKADFSYRAYCSHNDVKGPMSEVEEALSALPKTIDKKDFGKSMGYSLLATVSGKPLPPQLANYASGAGNAAQTSSNLYGRTGGSHNFFAKPSLAKAANVNKPPPGAAVLPGWGATSPTSAKSNASASPLSSPTASSAASGSPSPSPAAASPGPSVASVASTFGSSVGSASASASAAGAPLTVSTGKCLVSTCSSRRVKNGYCLPCLEASEKRRQAIFGDA